MKNASVQLCLVIFILLLTQTASAVPFTVERSFMLVGTPEILSPLYGPVRSWTFDLRPKGFDPDTYDIISATLTLGLSDDGGWTKGDNKTQMNEYALLDAGEDRFGPWEVEGPYKAAGAKPFALKKSLDYLSDYGTLPITLRTVALGYGRRGDVIGDFALYWAKLDVEAEPVSAPVPEPATMLLIGSGLVGLAGYGRRKFFKK